MHSDAHAMGVVIRVTLSCLALLAVLFGIVIPTIQETLRQNVFELRRKLFRYMADGHVSPDEPAYRHVYGTMNVVIRRAEKITMSRLLLAAFLRRPATDNIRTVREKSLAQVKDPVVRAQLAAFRTQIGIEIVRHVLMTSPITAPPIFAIWMFAHVRGAFRRASKAGKRTVRIAQSSIEVIEEEAQKTLDDDDPDRWSFPPPSNGRGRGRADSAAAMA